MKIFTFENQSLKSKLFIKMGRVFSLILLSGLLLYCNKSAVSEVETTQNKQTFDRFESFMPSLVEMASEHVMSQIKNRMIVLKNVTAVSYRPSSVIPASTNESIYTDDKMSAYLDENLKKNNLTIEPLDTTKVIYNGFVQSLKQGIEEKTITTNDDIEVLTLDWMAKAKNSDEKNTIACYGSMTKQSSIFYEKNMESIAHDLNTLYTLNKYNTDFRIIPTMSVFKKIVCVITQVPAMISGTMKGVSTGTKICGPQCGVVGGVIGAGITVYTTVKRCF